MKPELVAFTTTRSAQFKTLKCRPDFPGRFDSIEAARRHYHSFFAWYNDEHRHGGLDLHTPADIHYGTAEAVRDQRAAVLTDAIPGAPRTVHPQAARAATPAHRLVDQPTRPATGGDSVNTAGQCLIQVDSFRRARSTLWA